jgi:hypothetical protein
MLALRTGWTPDVIAELPGAFRAGCHWALYAQTIAGPEGLPSTDLPPGTRATPELQSRRVEVSRLRTMLYPED